MRKKCIFIGYASGAKGYLIWTSDPNIQVSFQYRSYIWRRHDLLKAFYRLFRKRERCQQAGGA